MTVLARIALTIAGPAMIAALAAGPASAFSGPGINVNPWFTKPGIEGTWSATDRSTWQYADPPFPAFTPDSYRADLEQIAAAGFRFIRAPISPGPLLAMDGDARRAALSNIRTVLRTARAQGLDVIVNLHAGSLMSYDEIVRDEASRQTYIEALIDLVTVMQDLGPEHVLYETMNEPTGACGDEDWSRFQARILEAIATAHPDARMIATGACWGAIGGLTALDPAPFDSPRLYYGFHYYSPWVFTHQGNTWSGKPGNRVMTGLVWPAALGDLAETEEHIRAIAPQTQAFARYGEDSVDQAIALARDYYEAGPGPAFIKQDFDRVAAWAEKNSIPRERILLGEFGVLKRERKWQGADMDSAARWIRTVRQEAEAHGMPWAMWSYGEGMALTVGERDLRWYGEIVDALGLHRPADAEDGQ